MVVFQCSVYMCQLSKHTEFQLHIIFCTGDISTSPEHKNLLYTSQTIQARQYS